MLLRCATKFKGRSVLSKDATSEMGSAGVACVRRVHMLRQPAERHVLQHDRVGLTRARREETIGTERRPAALDGQARG